MQIFSTTIKLAPVASVALLAALTASGNTQAQSVCRGNECKATSGPIIVGPGDYAHVHNPACAGNQRNVVTEIVRAVAISHSPQVALYAGPMFNLGVDQFGQGLRNALAKQGGDLGRIISGVTNPVAACAILPVKLPKGARPTGYTLDWRESGGAWHNNTPVGNTDAWRTFSHEPVCEEAGGNGLICYAEFKHWSHNRTREARLNVYFEQPRGWAPPHAQPW